MDEKKSKSWQIRFTVWTAVVWVIVAAMKHFGVLKILSGEWSVDPSSMVIWADNVDWASLGASASGPALIVAGLTFWAQRKELSLLSEGISESRQANEKALEQTEAISATSQTIAESLKTTLEEQKQLAFAVVVSNAMNPAYDEFKAIVEETRLAAGIAHGMKLTQAGPKWWDQAKRMATENGMDATLLTSYYEKASILKGFPELKDRSNHTHVIAYCHSLLRDKHRDLRKRVVRTLSNSFLYRSFHKDKADTEAEVTVREIFDPGFNRELEEISKTLDAWKNDGQ